MKKATIKFLKELVKIFKSRTVITLTIIILTNLANAYSSVIPADAMVTITIVLTALAGYFRINPSQTF